MARRYAGGNFSPPPRWRGDVELRGLGARHWSLLSLLAEHGVLHTGQVTTLMFGSRPAAARHLRALDQAGLVWRSVDDEDPAHTAYYELSVVGAEVLAVRLREAGRPVPAALGQPGRDAVTVAAFFVGLVAASRAQGRGHVFTWRRALEAARWLRVRGVPDVDPAGYGVWIEDGHTVRFVLHIDHYGVAAYGPAAALPLADALAGYRHAVGGVPVTAILVLSRTAGRQADLHHVLAADPLPVTVGSTTFAVLAAVDSAAEAIWTTMPDDDRLLRLAQLGH